MAVRWFLLGLCLIAKANKSLPVFVDTGGAMLMDRDVADYQQAAERPTCSLLDLQKHH